MRASLCLLVVAGCDVGAVPEVSEVRYPRLVRVGDEGHITFDALGFPTSVKAQYTEYRYTWNVGQLVAIDARFEAFGERRAIHADPTFRDGLLVEIETNGARHDELVYNADGALITWRWKWPSGPVRERSYSYDDRGRLTRVEKTAGLEAGEPRVDLIEYDALECPARITNDVWSNTFEYADGRLAGIGTYTYVTSPMRYDLDGNIVNIGSADGRFSELTYEKAPARGLDLWPGHTFGGYGYGFPMHGELFRLDGSCDPTLTSQAAIMAMVIPELFY